MVLERTVGKGSMVLLAETYLLSNEALRNDRSPGFLAWLQGTGRQALFDEFHLGVQDEPGMISLIGKHRLVPMVAALLILAALYVWKGLIPFAGSAAPIEGHLDGETRDNFSGLVNLLKRNIGKGDLLATCFREWSRSFSREMGRSPELAAKLQALVNDQAAEPVGRRDPVAVYRKMTELLGEMRLK